MTHWPGCCAIHGHLRPESVQAARAAYMHRNTFSVRLAKLQELSKADLTNGEIQQRMVFSYKILRYYDRYAKINLGKRLAASPPQEGKE